MGADRIFHEPDPEIGWRFDQGIKEGRLHDRLCKVSPEAKCVILHGLEVLCAIRCRDNRTIDKFCFTDGVVFITKMLPGRKHLLPEIRIVGSCLCRLLL